MKAPFKRGTKLIYKGRCGEIEVTYIKWMGFERSSLIVVEGPDGTRTTVHVDDVKEKT